MARTIDEMPANKRTASKYPLDEWLNGDVWELIQGKDFTATVRSFVARLHTEAAARQRTVQTRHIDGKLYVQARVNGE